MLNFGGVPHDPLGIWSNATICRCMAWRSSTNQPPEVECGHLGGYCNAVGIQVDEMDGGRNNWGRMTGWWQLKYVFLNFTPKLGEMMKFDEHIFQMGWKHQLVWGFVHKPWHKDYFSPLFGEDSHFDEHIFQLGWFNHQPDEKKSNKTPISDAPCFWNIWAMKKTLVV